MIGKLYSKPAAVITAIYLIMSGIGIYRNITCSGFLCGLEVLLAVYPAILLNMIIDPSFSLTNNRDFLFGTIPGFIVLVLIHALVIYTFVLLVSRTKKK